MYVKADTIEHKILDVSNERKSIFLTPKGVMVITFKYSALFLILAEVCLIFSSAYWPDTREEPLGLLALNSLLFCIGGYTLARSRRWLACYIALSLFFIVSHFGDSLAWVLLREVSLTLILAMIFHAVIKHSFFRDDVPRYDRLLAGVAGYILLGLFWSTQFNLLADLGTMPLKNLDTGKVATPQENLYFGFVTLTAVGYGEIVPATPMARSFAMIASLSGVLYLAIFISTLVSRVRNN